MLKTLTKLPFFHQLQEDKIKILIQKEKIDISEEFKVFSTSNKFAGSINVFLGKVRKKSKYGSVKYIEIENYEGMTDYQIEKISKKAKKIWNLEDILIIHRYGKINVGEEIVLILVASEHRKEGLEAIKYLINWLKIKATFWKKEITSNGDYWVDQSPEDLQILKS